MQENPFLKTQYLYGCSDLELLEKHLYGHRTVAEFVHCFTNLAIDLKLLNKVA